MPRYRESAWLKGFGGAHFRGEQNRVASHLQGLLDELVDHCAQANRFKFDGSVAGVTLSVNPRLRALAGRVFFDEKRIELSGYHLSQPYARQVAFKALEHEMLHLYLDTRGLPTGHTPLFLSLIHI